MGSIVTFYSYKGGVGRSMAVANIALLLARRDLKVLVWRPRNNWTTHFFALLRGGSVQPG